MQCSCPLPTPWLWPNPPATDINPTRHSRQLYPPLTSRCQAASCCLTHAESKEMACTQFFCPMPTLQLWSNPTATQVNVPRFKQQLTCTEPFCPLPIPWPS